MVVSDAEPTYYVYFTDSTYWLTPVGPSEFFCRFTEARWGSAQRLSERDRLIAYIGKPKHSFCGVLEVTGPAQRGEDAKYPVQIPVRCIVAAHPDKGVEVEREDVWALLTQHKPVRKKSRGWSGAVGLRNDLGRLATDVGERVLALLLAQENLLFADVTRAIDSNEQGDALDDLDVRQTRVPFSGTRYRRNPEVRRNVRNRAEGKCELCGARGFLQPDGSSYLECHHIIALANDGEDRVSNVIALCPEHHREAHFGRRANLLEAQMIEALKRLGTR